MRRSTALGFGLCGLAMVTVGSAVVASKLIATGLPPFTAAALRFAMALPVFLLLMIPTRGQLRWPGRRDAGLLLAQAALGSVGYTALLVVGLRFTSAADAGVVAGTLTAVAGALAILLLGERPTGRGLLAVALAGGGIVAVTWDAGGVHPAPGRTVLLGNAIVLAAVMCEAVFLLLNKRLRLLLPPLAQSTAMTGLGLMVATPFALLEQPWTTSPDPVALVAVAYSALVPTVAGFLLWYAGAARLTGMQAALATAILPVSTLVLAAVALGEAIGLAQIVGMLLVLAAIALGARPSTA